MNSYKKKLTLMVLVLVFLSSILTGAVAAEWLKDKAMEAERTHMEQELSIFRVLLEGQNVDAGDANPELLAYLQKVAQAIEARITWMLADGRVLFDSEGISGTGDGPLKHEEIQQAINEGVGFASRMNHRTGQDILFAAAAIGNAQAPEGYIRIARETEDFHPPLNELWFFIITGLILFLAAAMYFANRSANQLTAPLEQMTKVARQITHHNSQVRIERQGMDEIRQLGKAINTMADSLQKQVEQTRQNESRLKRVLDNMHSGVMMIDRHGNVVLVNRSGEGIFGISSREVIGRPYKHVELPQELLQKIQLCLANQESIQSELTVHYPEEAILDVSINPLPDFQEEGYGVLVVLHNLTAVRRLERMRSEFVANVSHELKTPVASVKGFAETLLAGAVNDRETANSFLQIIHDESERINRIIGDLLELSKIESKREPLHFSPVDLEQMIGQTVHLMNAEARKKI
ncbi:sensor histidine kinase [Paenibacillus senegalensis]|uniref:sensor histidine kinase n=1 Tax=Paenibacillus senegalensis TaxID=1465766 RepID=UPI0002D88864|nr:histidine kinase dimerization/phospho-acceptor domain-containing protein [Paenibacillus senegalensis]